MVREALIIEFQGVGFDVDFNGIKITFGTIQGRCIPEISS
jgi:hypothetical protein